MVKQVTQHKVFIETYGMTVRITMVKYCWSWSMR